MSREDDVLAKLAKLEALKSSAPSRSVQKRITLQVRDEVEELSAKLAENHEKLSDIATDVDGETFSKKEAARRSEKLVEKTRLREEMSNEFDFTEAPDDKTIFIVRDAQGKKLCEVWHLPDTMKGEWQIVSPWESTTFDHDSLLAHLRELSEKELDNESDSL